jgi:hypothetical protein
LERELSEAAAALSEAAYRQQESEAAIEAGRRRVVVLAEEKEQGLIAASAATEAAYTRQRELQETRAELEAATGGVREKDLLATQAQATSAAMQREMLQV